MWKLIVLFASFVFVAGAATNGEWSEWSSYGDCIWQHSTAIKTRKRMCNGGTKCPGVNKMSLECTCGREGKGRRGNDYVFGGDLAEPYQYPWMVYVRKTVNGRTSRCGGSLISDMHVLTAKHCTLSQESKLVYLEPVKVGIHNFKTDNYEEVEVEKAIYPDPHDVAMHEHDIAILVLKNNVNLTDPRIGTLCLPESGNEVYRGKRVKGMGWGLVGFNVVGTGDLRAADLVVSHQRHKYYLYTKLEKKNGVWQDACGGDSGGPLIYKTSSKWTVIGTVYGAGYDCRTNTTDGNGIWNKVTAHLKWIKNVIGEGGFKEGEGCKATRKSIRSKCVFPFKYKGVSYNGCIEKASADRPWCATEVEDNGDYKNFGYCEDLCPVYRGCKTTAKERCVFPFKYNGRKYNECGTQDYKPDWCATDVDGNGNYIGGKWGYCTSLCP